MTFTLPFPFYKIKIQYMRIKNKEKKRKKKEDFNQAIRRGRGLFDPPCRSFQLSTPLHGGIY